MPFVVGQRNRGLCFAKGKHAQHGPNRGTGAGEGVENWRKREKIQRLPAVSHPVHRGGKKSNPGKRRAGGTRESPHPAGSAARNFAGVPERGNEELQCTLKNVVGDDENGRKDNC